METSERPPLIICFVADLFFAVRIESVAQNLDFQVDFIEHQDQITPADQYQPEKQLAEHLTGPGAVLIDKLTNWLPALVIFDLSNEGIPWRQWIPLIKSSPATRRIPVISFASHKDKENIGVAKECGSDLTVARSRFSVDLPKIIQSYARIPDYLALRETCQQSLSELAIRGIEEFNRGEFFQSHETLEEAWNEDQTVGRELYRAILQVAVAYLQIERNNYPGALKMFLRVRQWINPLPDICRGVNVAQLRRDAEIVHHELIALGPEKIEHFNRSLFHPVIFSDKR